MSTKNFLSNRKTRWIFLSPHLDDAVFSCGGLIAYLSGNGINVEIWTIFSKQETDESRLTEYARSLHRRWGIDEQTVRTRVNEDRQACQTIGANSEYFGFKDCIYRELPATGKPVVNSDAELFGKLHPGEQYLIDEITSALKARQTEPSVWVCPLGLGDHIDHRIVRQAAEFADKLMLYYADLPYALERPVQTIPGLIQLSFNLPSTVVQTWGKANLQYASQISSFWKDAAEMAGQYSSFLERYQGMPLWLPNPDSEMEK